MPRRTGEPQRLGGSERLPAWRVSLSEEPTAEWRREFLRHALASGIFQKGQIAVEADALVFELERSALTVTCDMLDQWIARANGGAEGGPPGVPATTILTGKCPRSRSSMREPSHLHVSTCALAWRR